jgi:hypothetical protein
METPQLAPERPSTKSILQGYLKQLQDPKSGKVEIREPLKPADIWLIDEFNTLSREWQIQAIESILKNDAVVDWITKKEYVPLRSGMTATEYADNIAWRQEAQHLLRQLGIDPENEDLTPEQLADFWLIDEFNTLDLSEKIRILKEKLKTLEETFGQELRSFLISGAIKFSEDAEKANPIYSIWDTVWKGLNTVGKWMNTVGNAIDTLWNWWKGVYHNATWNTEEAKKYEDWYYQSNDATVQSFQKALASWKETFLSAAGNNPMQLALNMWLCAINRQGEIVFNVASEVQNALQVPNTTKINNLRHQIFLLENKQKNK